MYKQCVVRTKKLVDKNVFGEGVNKWFGSWGYLIIYYITQNVHNLLI